MDSLIDRIIGFSVLKNPNLDPQEVPLHSPKVTAWIALSIKGILGPYWFEDEQGKAVTVNQHNYQGVVKKFHDELRSRRLGATTAWLMQDGATCHTAKSTMDCLKTLFGSRIIIGKLDVLWPPNSPDLNPLDYFLWGYCKENVYKNKPRTLEELKSEVEKIVSEISQDTLKKVIGNFATWLNLVVEKNGSHIEHVMH